MEKENSPGIEVKYQKLATEFSKVRSQATVLKKALLDEQAKNVEMKDLLRKHEQQIRKHDQEMDSLLFRNEQLTKRISVLQEELQASSKKGRNKSVNNTQSQPDMGVINEELQKKIMENAQLLSSMTDKDIELSDCKEKIDYQEKKIHTLKKNLDALEIKYSDDIAKLKRENLENNKVLKNDVHLQDYIDSSLDNKKVSDESEFWQQEAKRWKSECAMLRSKPNSNEQLTEYYESQISQMLETEQVCLAETKTLWAENTALSKRLENLLIAHKELELKLDSNQDDLSVTTQNYKAQLDAMTEHLAAQNDKITKQSDEIEMLKHRLLSKK